MRFVTPARPRRNLVRSISKLATGFCRTPLHSNFKFKTALKSWICQCFLDSEVRTGVAVEVAIFAIRTLRCAERKSKRP